MEIGAFEAKNKLGMLLDRVEMGEEITITRHGKPVARLISDRTRIDQQQSEQALERLRVRARKLKLAFNWKDLAADRDAGRP
jgi:prevent-host-death family protein